MSIIVAILVFSIIIIIHELGHFLLAKKNGIGVVEFSIGLGPTIWGITKGETRLGTLITILLKDGLTDVVELVAVDEKVRAEYYKKYNIE